MIVPYVQFVSPVPILGTSERQEHFSAEQGWVLEVFGDTVTLRREARQNVPAVPGYVVRGVGFCSPQVTVEEAMAPAPLPLRKVKR